MSGRGSLALVLNVPIFSVDGAYYFERQACNGLRLWLKHFDTINLAAPLRAGRPPAHLYQRLDAVDGAGRIQVWTLPTVFHPLRFLRAIVGTRKKLNRLLDQSDYLHLAIGGVWGDWPTVAAWLAHRRGLRFAIWTDNVVSGQARFKTAGKTGLRRLYWQATTRLTILAERWAARHCTLGMYHGRDTYDAYAGWTREPHLVHDIHVRREQRISSAALERRLEARPGRPFRIAYAGRAHPLKGVFDWIDVLGGLIARGIAFDAVWFGDGPEREAALSLVRSRGWEDRIAFPGNVDDHGELLRRLQDFDAFLFCHKTAESPRSLIEALLCGLPLVGYDSAYQRDLIAGHDGGVLTPIDDVVALTEAIAALAADDEALAKRTRAAHLDGEAFSDEEVFRHRSDLLKRAPARGAIAAND